MRREGTRETGGENEGYEKTTKEGYISFLFVHVALASSLPLLSDDVSRDVLPHSVPGSPETNVPFLQDGVRTGVL